MNGRIKKVWIDEANMLLAFHPIADGRMHVKREPDFWKWIISLTEAGYGVL